jgi:hypothetical protein
VTRSRVHIWAAVAALAIGGTADAAAQARSTPSATLRLTVKDPSGAVIPGAVVRIRGIEAGTDRVSGADHLSDGQGTATIAGLPPGRYAVDVSFPGFQTSVIPDLRLRAGETRRDVVLAIEKLDENHLSNGGRKLHRQRGHYSAYLQGLQGRIRRRLRPQSPHQAERAARRPF